jgi:peptidoglycan hydrolase-like protein with peptidoglycan-binding domain
MPDLWNAYGFRWGGDYKSNPDAMHYEFMGSVGDMIRFTQLARKNLLGDARTTPGPNDFPGTIKMGSRGPAVRSWQTQLKRVGYGLNVDGVAGPTTNHYLIDFQKKHGLAADGIGGPSTWHKLIHT